MAKGGQIQTQLLLDISTNTLELKKGLADAQRSVDNFSSNITKIATTLGVAFGVKEVLNFGFEVSQLAAKAQGVEAAFSKLPNSVRLLNDLRAATKNTVSDLELQQKAVQFQNFGLEISKLPTLLKFASVQAQQTGADINFLVDSIVTSLGRKSVLILDNLGISSAQLNAELEKTPDFVQAATNIIEQRLSVMGDIAENNVTKVQRLNSSWENYKVAIGDAANGTGVLGTLVDSLTMSLDVASSKNLSFWEKFLAFASAGSNPMSIYTAKVKDAALESVKLAEEQKKNEQVIREVDRAYIEFNKNIDSYGKAISTHQYRTELLAEFTRRLVEEEKKRQGAIENITNLTAKLNTLNELQLTQTGNQLAATNREIESINNKIKALKELGVAQSKTLSIGATDPNKFNKINTDVGTPQPYLEVPKVKTPDMSQLNRQLEITNMLMNQVGEQVNTVFNQTFAEGVAAAVSSLGNLLIEGEGVFKSFVTSMLKGLQQIINGLFAQAIAGLIARETSSKGIVGLAIAAAGIGALTSLWQSKVPAFKSGGDYKGGLALVGEAGPELINFNRGGRVYNNSDTMKMLGSSEMSNQIEVVGVIRGEDIYLSNQRVTKQRGKVM